MEAARFLEVQLEASKIDNVNIQMSNKYFAKEILEVTLFDLGIALLLLHAKEPP